jgi:hypothetical protein
MVIIVIVIDKDRHQSPPNGLPPLPSRPLAPSCRCGSRAHVADVGNEYFDPAQWGKRAAWFRRSSRTNAWIHSRSIHHGPSWFNDFGWSELQGNPPLLQDFIKGGVGSDVQRLGENSKVITAIASLGRWASRFPGTIGYQEITVK